MNVHIVLLDLMSQASVKTAAAEITRLSDRLYIMINNAGIMTQRQKTTQEGIEGQFGANHIGHFLLTNLLMPQLLTAARSNASGSTRIINLTSLGHRLSPVRFSDYNLEKEDVPIEESHASLPPMFAARADDGYSEFVAYGQAKSANMLFLVELNGRLSHEGIMSYAVHPGCKLHIHHTKS